MRFAIPVAAVLCLTLALPATAQWTGEERDVDGVTHVMNPADPVMPPQTVELTEMWRLGGYSDAPEEFFGVISDIVADEQNNFYVLDAQLSEVRIFDQSGAYVNTIGREGEGPGEFRRPQDLNLMPDGTVGVVQPRPSKMILLTKTGDPAGEYSITPRGAGFPFLQSVSTVGDQLLVLYVMGNPDREKQVFTRTTRLSMFDANGEELVELTSTTTSSSFGESEYREVDWTGFDSAWSASREGTIAVRTSLLDYEVSVWNADGTLRHVIEREFQPLARSSEAIERERARREGAIGRWVKNPRFEMLPTEYPVQSIHTREDGTLWVRDAYGTFDRGSEELASFDVFNSAGHYERRITMRGDFDPRRDGLFLSGNYLLIVSDLESARMAMSAIGGDSDDSEGADPMEIVCYRMEFSGIARTSD